YTPATTLSFDTSYLVGLAGSAKDVNGNAMGGPFLSSFRTRPQPDVTPPHVLNTIPADGETGVARDPVLSISFDDAMDGPSTESAISLANASGPEQYLVSIGDFRWDGANHTVSFQSSAPLDWSRTYRVAVGPGARDDAGLALETTFSFSFRTAPWSARVIGRVADEGITVAGAIVTLAGQTTQTDDNGSFAFPSVPNGTYDLTVAKAGYAMTKVSVTVSQRDAAADGTTINVGTVELRRVEGPSPALVAASLGAAAVAVLLVGLVLRRLRPPPPEMEEPEDYEDAPDDEEFPEADEEPF
ncbi:MAG TPA: Ig-like domain-containing protein, partial [Thermoplasmata archaeon]|nr:Ig-like domain-containing protein [Thermoplasmata archaeon]